MLGYTLPIRLMSRDREFKQRPVTSRSVSRVKCVYWTH